MPGSSFQSNVSEEKRHLYATEGKSETNCDLAAR